MQIQQGDVMIESVDALPEGAVPIAREGDLILAQGEATGHAHRVKEVDALFFEKDGKIYLKNPSRCTVIHEEHKPVELEPGIWEIGRVREYDWLSKMVRPVHD